LWGITIGSVLDFTIVEIIIVTDAILISILGVAVGSVVGFNKGLDSECQCFQEVVFIFGILFKLGTFDGRSSENINRAANLWDLICIRVFETYADGVVSYFNTVIKQSINVLATEEILNWWLLKNKLFIFIIPS